jgi:hypothetical protein
MLDYLFAQTPLWLGCVRLLRAMLLAFETIGTAMADEYDWQAAGMRFADAPPP